MSVVVRMQGELDQPGISFSYLLMHLPHSASKERAWS
jgi:hypothetical protein